MTTPDASKTNDQLDLRDSCDVCNERRARWMSPNHGRDFTICDVCRTAEPCERCGVERDRCDCDDGPLVIAWLPLTGEG